MAVQTPELQRIHPADTIRSILDTHPDALPVLRRHGIDACCGGAHPLEFACDRHGVSLEQVLRELDAVCARPVAGTTELGPGQFDGSTSVRTIIARHPETVPVFERAGLMGCGGALGPDEPLEFFARVHHVDLKQLTKDLRRAASGEAIAPRPDSASAPRAAAAGPVPDDNARVFVPFFVASLLLTLSFGATLGMINIARLTTSWFGALARPAVYAHAYVQVFGFVGLFVMGVAYHVIPRFAGVPLQSPALSARAFWLQLSGLLVLTLGFLVPGDHAQSLWIAGALGLTAGGTLFGTSIVRTLRVGQRAPEPFEPWVAIGSIWLVVASALTVVAAAANDPIWHHVMWPIALFGFAGSWIFGVGRRIFPVFLGWTPRGGHFERLVFALYQVGVLLWSIGAWPEQGPALRLVRATGAVALLGSVPAYGWILGLFGAHDEPHGHVDRGYERYVYAAWAWLFVGLATGPLWTLGALAQANYGSIVMQDFSRHAIAFGFITQMMMGVATRVLPVFTGHRLWSPRARAIAFWSLNGAVAIRGLEAVVAAGYLPSAWPIIAWSGPPAVAAVLLFAINIVLTMRGGVEEPRGQANGEVADAIVADVLAIPGALEVLVAAGFTPLRNPVMRATVARTVTLRQACRMHGVPLEAIVPKLQALRRAGKPKTIPLQVVR